jgi:hypothetical protein
MTLSFSCSYTGVLPWEALEARMPRGRGRPAPFFDTLEPWFAVSFWCDGQEVEREARCCIMPIEAVAGQSAAGERPPYLRLRWTEGGATTTPTTHILTT